MQRKNARNLLLFAKQEVLGLKKKKLKNGKEVERKRHKNVGGRSLMSR